MFFIWSSKSKYSSKNSNLSPVSNIANVSNVGTTKSLANIFAITVSFIDADSAYFPLLYIDFGDVASFVLSPFMLKFLSKKYDLPEHPRRRRHGNPH